MGRLVAVPAHGRLRSISILIAVVALIGAVDYGTGPRLSLELFYLIPISLSVAWLGPRAGFVTSLVSIVVRVSGDLATGPYTYPATAFWNRFVDLLVYFAFVWGLDALITLQRRLEQRVKERTIELVNAADARRHLEQELLLVGARERNLFGQELHDDICQHLVATAFAAQVLTKNLTASDAAAATKAQAIVGLIETGADKTRKLARGLMLSAIEPEKLAESLAEFVEENNQPSRPCHFRQDGGVLVSDAGVAAQLFRIGQEAIRNALKHADARQIDVALVGDNDGTITLSVEDDGTGIPTKDHAGPGIGMRIMSHRASLIGGTLTVEPRPGRGTRIQCVLPQRVPTS
jgi:signal transduction histidine kinase